MSTYNLPDRIKIVNPAANVDSQYGPWSSSAAAASSVNSALRVTGLTVGVLSAGSVVEYWWEANTTDGGLVPKNLAFINRQLAASTIPLAALIDEDDMATNAAASVPSQQSVKAYVDTARDRWNVQTLTIANQAASNTSLAIAATADIVKVTRSYDWQPTSVTGFTLNKPITFQFVTSASGVIPWQVTFPSNVKLNDGVSVFLKNNSSSTSPDEVVIKGLDSASGQVIGDVTYGS